MSKFSFIFIIGHTGVDINIYLMGWKGGEGWGIGGVMQNYVIGEQLVKGMGLETAMEQVIVFFSFLFLFLFQFLFLFLFFLPFPSSHFFLFFGGGRRVWGVGN